MKIKPLIFVFCFTLFTAVSWADQRVAQLDSPDYDQREQATQALLGDTTLTLESLQTLAADADSIEQRHRMLVIARHHALRLLRAEHFPDRGPGAIGINYPNANNRATPNPHIPITKVLPGFPAMGKLQANDVLTAFNGNPLAGPGKEARLQELISACTAGDTVTLSLQRQGQAFEVELILASGESLNVMYHQGGQTDLVPDYINAWLEVRDEYFSNLLPSTEGLSPDPTQ